MIGVASLRVGDPNVRLAIAAGGGPVYTNDWLHVACVLCGCAMSQWVDVPNGINDGCADQACLCHREDMP